MYLILPLFSVLALTLFELFLTGHICPLKILSRLRPKSRQEKNQLALFAALFCVGLALFGCAPLKPGADPLVVRVEQTETIAKDTFDMVLGIDNSQRAFYASNAPAFHSFCEWLRQPQSISADDATALSVTTLPRASAMLLSLDDIKVDYKAARASSNTVYTALQVVTGAMAQANTWLTALKPK